MKAKISYSELVSVLGYVNTILSDKTVDDKMKNVIFLVEKDEVTVVGYSPIVFARTNMSDIEVSDVEDNWDFQVKSSDLNKILASFTNLYKTKVDYIELEKIETNSKIIVTIHEEALKEEDDRLSQTSRFLLDNIPIMESVKKEIYMDFPEETDIVPSEELLIYINSLYPLMSNDSASSLVSKLNFSEEYVFVNASYINSFMKNKLTDSFKGLTLGYSSIAFLKKLCEGVDGITCKKIERYLCVESGVTEAFIKYQKVKVKPDTYVKRFSNENGIVLDRLYLKDVLKRMLVASQDGVAKVTDLGLEVSNNNFSQILPLEKVKGDVENLSFKLSVPVFMKTILGDDNIFPDKVFLYFVKTGSNGYLLFVRDATGGWFSTIQVRV